MFDAADVKATFFVLGWVAERFPRLVRQIANGGHEIASHGYEHGLVYSMTAEEFRDDLRRARVRWSKRVDVLSSDIARQAIRSSAIALGPRCTDRRRLRLRLQHLPNPARPIRHSGLAA